MMRDSILIEADELLEKWDHESMRIYDASVTNMMYLQGHIPGAAYFDHEKFSDPHSPYMCTILPDDALEAQIGKAGISNDAEVVVYACGMLPYAARAWWVLRYAGHKNVRILNGGLSAWEKAGGQIEQEVRQYQPSVFKARINPKMFASKEEVMAAMEDDNVATVDVLPLESYEASHIVGSTCLPCLDLMQGMDYFLPDDNLVSRLGEISKHKRIITYCGGGIAAAINAAAHLITGHENVAIYDGSMYEWLAEGLPVKGTGEWEVWFKK
jgi:thiosulfate/3-mercaptopyruvate sulfurtransferase